MGRGPSAADRVEQLEEISLREHNKHSLMQFNIFSENVESFVEQQELIESINMAQDNYRVNTRDTHRSDKKKKAKSKVRPKTRCCHEAQVKFFERSVEGVSMDIIEYKSEMASFEFRILDTMGYLQAITMCKGHSTCSSPGCKKKMPSCKLDFA